MLRCGAWPGRSSLEGSLFELKIGLDAWGLLIRIYETEDLRAPHSLIVLRTHQKVVATPDEVKELQNAEIDIASRRWVAPSWGLESITTGDPLAPVMIVGDLFIRIGERVVGVTVGSSVHFREAFEVSDSDHLEARTRPLAAWASELLYDAAAIDARKALAAVGEDPGELPGAAPVSNAETVDGQSG